MCLLDIEAPFCHRPVKSTQYDQQRQEFADSRPPQRNFTIYRNPQEPITGQKHN